MSERHIVFARYNAWANARLYCAGLALSEADWRADRGAFFKSVHGTLNHLLVGDRVWMRRFTGEGPQPTRLDEILFEDREALWAARQAEDARIVTFAEGLNAGRLAGTIRFSRMGRPESVLEEPLAPLIDHFFNHQTHHRGQVHCLLTGLTGKAPELDLLLYLREVAW